MRRFWERVIGYIRRLCRSFTARTFSFSVVLLILKPFDGRDSVDNPVRNVLFCSSIRIPSKLIVGLVDHEPDRAKPLFGLQPDTHGRFSMVRHLVLDLKAMGERYRGEQCKVIEEEWSGFLQQTVFTHSAFNICFPYLRVLELIFDTSFVDEQTSLRVSWQAMRILSLLS